MSLGGTETIAERVRGLRHRIAALNPKYRAYSHLAPLDCELIRRLDEEAAAGKPRSPVHGLTFSVKGNIPVATLPWTEGSAIFEGRVATHDAAIVEKVKAGGGIILGTTTLSELAMYGVENPFEPMGLNPWDTQRTAGGSSTGAGVACALQLADVNIGTDSGGSIRNPACHCGAVGFMPQIGALSTEGKANYTPSLSSIGLIARSVSTVIQAFAVLGGENCSVEPSRRLVVPARLIERMSDGPTRALFRDAERALRASGFTLIERDIEGWLEAEHAGGVISLFESGQALKSMDLTRASAGIRKRAAMAKALQSEEVAAARSAAERFKKNLRESIDACQADAVVTPTWPFAAPLIKAETVLLNGREVPIDPHRNCFVRVGNAVNACAITLPAGIYPDEGVPAGLHFMAPGGRHARLLATALSVEAALPPPPCAPALAAYLSKPASR